MLCFISSIFHFFVFTAALFSNYARFFISCFLFTSFLLAVFVTLFLSLRFVLCLFFACVVFYSRFYFSIIKITPRIFYQSLLCFLLYVFILFFTPALYSTYSVALFFIFFTCYHSSLQLVKSFQEIFASHL